MSDDSLRPRDHAEAIALFRAEVIAARAHREFLRGELAKALRELADDRAVIASRRPATRVRRGVVGVVLAR